MESSFPNQLRSIQTSSYVLWHMQLTYNLSTHDRHLILQANNVRENCDLYR